MVQLTLKGGRTGHWETSTWSVRVLILLVYYLAFFQQAIRYQEFLLSYMVCNHYYCTAWQHQVQKMIQHSSMNQQQQLQDQLKSNISSLLLTPPSQLDVHLRQKQHVLTANHSVAAISKQHTLQKQYQQQLPPNDESWYRAYQQVNALLSDTLTVANIQTSTTNYDKNSIYIQQSTHLVVSIVLEKFVQRIKQQYYSPTTLQQPHQSIVAANVTESLYTIDPIDAIDAIMNKLMSCQTDFYPTQTTLENIYLIYRYCMQQTEQPFPFQVYVARSTKLFQYWITSMNSSSFNLNHHDPNYQQRCTILYFAQRFFQSILVYQNINKIESNILMSMDLWNLYLSFNDLKSVSVHNNENRSRDLRIINMAMLRILRNAGTGWDHYQSKILSYTIRHTPKAEISNMIALYGGHETFIHALIASAKVGRIKDTSYVSRVLASALQNATSEVRHVHAIINRAYMIHFESLYHSNETKSRVMMERMLKKDALSPQKQMPNVSLNHTTFKLLLYKFARTSDVRSSLGETAGREAEQYFYKEYKNIYHGAIPWLPDVECANCIIDSYLQPSASSQTDCLPYLASIQEAGDFICQYIRQFGLRRCQGSDPILESILPRHLLNRNVSIHGSSSHIFEKLLTAYCNEANEFAITVSKSQQLNIGHNSSNYLDDAQMLLQLMEEADKMFRFFMIQHRNGKIETEHPHVGHVEQLRSIYKHCSVGMSQLLPPTNTGTCYKQLKKYYTMTRTMQTYLDNIEEYQQLINKKLRKRFN